jgi:hypothetical protein
MVIVYEFFSKFEEWSAGTLSENQKAYQLYNTYLDPSITETYEELRSKKDDSSGELSNLLLMPVSGTSRNFPSPRDLVMIMGRSDTPGPFTNRSLTLFTLNPPKVSQSLSCRSPYSSIPFSWICVMFFLTKCEKSFADSWPLMMLNYLA